MGPQIAPIGERAIAVLTAEWLLPGVSPDVTLEQPRPGERFSTEMTLAGQRVRSDVHLQCSQTDVDLLAVLAREGFLRLALGRGAMELLVFRQAGVRRVGFTAIGALVPRRRCRRRGRREGRRRGQGCCGSVRHHLLDFRVRDRRASRRASGRRPSAVASRG